MEISLLFILLGMFVFQPIMVFLQNVIDTLQKGGIVSIYLSHEKYGVLVDRDIALPFHQYYVQNGNAVEIRDMD